MDVRQWGTVVAIAFAVVPRAHAQLLDRASRAVRGDDSPSYSRDDDDDDDDEDDYGSSSDDDDSGLLDRASRAVRDPSPSRSYEPSYGGAVVVSGAGGYDTYQSGWLDSTYALGEYPYASNADGYAVPEQGGGTRTAGIIDIEAGYALGGAGRAGLAARVMLEIPMDISARYSVFIEPSGSGAQLAALGRAGLAWRMLDIPSLQLRIGAGVRHFQDGLGGMFGADIEVGVDIFPGSPWILSLDGSVGFVGEAMVAQARASIGIAIDFVEIYAGYDYEGLVAAEHVDLGGPMLGARVWL